MSTHNIYLIAIILGLFISVSFFSEDFNLGSDFISYYTGASLLKNRQGNRLYHIEEQKSFQKKFPKYSDLILLPFKAVPFFFLFFFFLLITLFFFFFFFFFKKILEKKKKKKKKKGTALKGRSIKSEYLGN